MESNAITDITSLHGNHDESVRRILSMTYLDSQHACSGTGWCRLLSVLPWTDTRSSRGVSAHGDSAGPANATLDSRWHEAGPSDVTPDQSMTLLTYSTSYHWNRLPEKFLHFRQVSINQSINHLFAQWMQLHDHKKNSEPDSKAPKWNTHSCPYEVHPTQVKN